MRQFVNCFCVGRVTKSSFPVPLIHNAGVLKIFRGGEGTLGRQAARAAAVDPVQHETHQRHPLGGQALHEVRGLAQRVPLRRRHHQERRTGAWSSLYVASARVRKPPKVVSIAATKVCTSFSS